MRTGGDGWIWHAKGWQERVGGDHDATPVHKPHVVNYKGWIDSAETSTGASWFIASCEGSVRASRMVLVWEHFFLPFPVPTCIFDE